MSSDKLDRKRRSEIDISDDSADELPPVKIRKSESSPNFARFLTDKLKNILNWLAPESLKNYMIDIRRSFNQVAATSLGMGIEDDIKNNGVEDDDDEIAVIAVQNGTTGVRSRAIGDQRHISLPSGIRPGSVSICPLGSRSFSFPLFTHSSSIDRTSRTMERRQMNGFAIRHDNMEDKSRHKRTGNEKCVAPFTNPSSDIEILLEGESLKGDKEIEIISEYPAKHSPGPTRKAKLNDYYNSSRREKANYAEDLINGTSYSRPSLFNNSFTAHEVVRLQERAQYKLLLDKVVKRSIYRPAVPKRDTQTSAIHVDLTEDEEKPAMNYHFKKEKVEHVSDFLSKYYKPCTLVPCTPKITESQRRQNLSVNNKEDDVQIIDYSDLPKLKPRKKSSPDESVFSDAWINELKMTILSETERRLQIVAEQEEKVQRYKKRRDARIAEDQRKRDEQRLAGIIFPDDAEMEEDVLPEITPEMETIIARAFGPGDPNEQLSFIDRLTLTRNDVATLSKLNWLNDQVINFYLALIAERSKLDNFPSVHAFNSFFYTSLKTRGSSNVLRWTRRIDIFSFDIIIVPLHLEMHWALLVVDNRSKQIKYYDSMGSGEDKCLRIIQNYLIVEMQDKKKITMEPNMYSLEIPKDIPKQMNGSDCGMFTLKYAEYLSRDAPITFSQENMPYFRRRMVYELLTKQIL